MSSSATHSKRYREGDVIIVGEPLVHAIKREYKKAYCDYCVLYNTELKKCAKCHQMYYCGQSCQKSDWKLHKRECDLFKSSYNYEELNIPDELLVRLMLRLVVASKADPNFTAKKYESHNGIARCFDDLLTHENKIKSDNEWRAKGLQMLRNVFNKLAIEITDKQIIQCLGRVITNMSEIRVNETLTFFDEKSQMNQKLISGRTSLIGFGIYLPITVFNHSCSPNAAYMSHRNKLVVRALKPIEPSDEICISYVSPEMTKPERHFLLKRNHFIEKCKCEKCVSNADDSIDYERMHYLEDKFISFSTDRGIVAFDAENQPTKRDLNGAIKVGEEMLAILRQIYPTYHPNLSAKMFIHSLSLSQAVNDPHCSQTKESVKPFIGATLESLVITHGLNHELLKCYDQCYARQFGVSLYPRPQ